MLQIRGGSRNISKKGGKKRGGTDSEAVVADWLKRGGAHKVKRMGKWNRESGGEREQHFGGGLGHQVGRNMKKGQSETRAV